MLKALKARGDKVGAATAEKIEEIWDEVERMTNEEKGEAFMFCRVDRTYNGETKRITMAIRDQDWRKAINKAMEELKWDRKYGRAPASFMERDMQQWVETLLAEK